VAAVHGSSDGCTAGLVRGVDVYAALEQPPDLFEVALAGRTDQAAAAQCDTATLRAMITAPSPRLIATAMNDATGPSFSTRA
jgi:hypothetical protein